MLLALARCTDNIVEPGSPVCESDLGCAVGLRCVAHACVPGCDTSFDCGDPLSLCLQGACVPRGEGLCGIDADCDTPPACSQLPGRCAAGHCSYTSETSGTACTDNDATTVADTCNGQGVCVGRSATEVHCTSSTQCPGGFYCGPEQLCRAQLLLGADCTVRGHESCASGYCDRGRCCVNGADCCAGPSDCPASYSATISCNDTSPATSCQGSRLDATCTNFVCGTVAVADDSICAGLMHACAGGFAAVTCTSASEQASPVCATTCATDSQCESGLVCVNQTCTTRPGTGATCTGAGQSTCADGLHCSNGICCDAAVATCCSTSAQCGNNLACNVVSSTCFVTCNDYDTSRCAAPSTSYCADNRCIARRADGTVCAGDGECLSDHCVEGVCCASACTDVCTSCLRSLTGRGDGICAPVGLGFPDAAPVPSCSAPGIGCSGSSCVCDGSNRGSAACLLALGQPCTTDVQCASDACECADATCSVTKCAVLHCGTCEFTTNGTTCATGLGSPTSVEDARDCSGDRTCSAGVCGLKNGIACTADGQCGSGHCECGDAGCSAGARRCASIDCGSCRFTSGGSSCDGALTIGTPCNDVNACTTSDTCNGSGQCAGSLVGCNSPRACESGPGSCDTGTGLCAYALKSAGVECRASTGVCDPAESCSGVSPTCPADSGGGALSTWYRDLDGDGYGDPGASSQTCGAAPAGYVADASDCDDGAAAVHPGATESCTDGVDNNCAGGADCADSACQGSSCSDDGDSCTSDVCNLGSCTHPAIPPVSCGCSAWSAWSGWSAGACTSSDGITCSAPASRYRTRTCGNPPASCGGTPCGETIEYEYTSGPCSTYQGAACDGVDGCYGRDHCSDGYCVDDGYC